jgi:hypothetical protein
MTVVDREEIPLDESRVHLPGPGRSQPALTSPDGHPGTRTMVLVLLSAEVGWLALLGGAIYAIWS